MSQTFVISALLTLVAGIGIFLIACNMMSANLEAMGSAKLSKLFASISNNDVLGVGIGTVGTAAIQSSGATTVMVIGFVNAGIMTLRQAATIIYGANIGTTITGQIVALGLYGKDSISTTIIFSAFAGVGAFIMSFCKEDKQKTWGGIIAGFGMLFVGLSMMSNSMESFAYLDSVKNFLAGIDNVILLIVIGAVLTAIIQSSSVMTSVAITMVVSGLISLNQGIYITMGSNIGSCVVAIIAAIPSSKNAKRAALIHLLFNISGVILFTAVGSVMKMVSGGDYTYGIIFSSFFKHPQTQLAMFHTFFNVLCAILILPLTGALVRFVSKIIPDSEATEDDSPKLYYLNEYMLNTPVIALAQLKKEIENMAKIAFDNFAASLEMFKEMSTEGVDKFRKNEDELNYLNRELIDILSRLSGSMLNDDDSYFMSRSFHVINDLERVGDYAENIIEYIEEICKIGGKISDEARAEIDSLAATVEALYQKTMEAYSNTNKDAAKAAAADAKVLEEKVDDLTEEMAANHIERIQKGSCTAHVGAYYLSLVSDSERVADHFYNVAKYV